ncbi:MAG: hypothetical protein MUE31_01465 [Candidatus Nanopelagicales bacterium]|nr:hypothetical protein [Candidatus Nanopelagicales bacterium]
MIIGNESTYEGISIPVLDPERVLPESVVGPAIQTARTPQRLRLVVRLLMADGRGSVTELRVGAATLVRLEHRGVGKRAGRLHIQPVKHGVRISARNRYTSEVLEVRVLAHHGRWRADRVAPHAAQ